MTIQEPFVKVSTIDKSQTNPSVNNDLNIGMVINAQTGPSGITRVADRNQFRNLYLTDDSINAKSDITLKSAYRLLGKTPLYITRAFSSNVLCGMTNNGNIIFTDENYTPFKKRTEITIEQKSTSLNNSYLVLKSIKYGSDSEETKTQACFYTGNKPSSITLTDGSAFSGDYYKFTLENSNDKTPIDSFFLAINKLILDNDLQDTFPPFIGIDFSGYIRYASAPNVSIVGYGVNIAEYIENISTSDYKLIGSVKPSDKKLDSIIVKQSNYISINNSTYYNAGYSPVNTTYPGISYPFYQYIGNVKPTEELMDEMPLPQYLINVYNEIYKDTTSIKPIYFDSLFTITLPSFGDGTTIESIELLSNDTNSIEYELLSNSLKFDPASRSITVSPYCGRINNVGIAITLVKGENDSKVTNRLVVYVGKLTGVTSADITYNPIDVYTIQKLVLRVGEWLSSNYYDAKGTSQYNLDKLHKACEGLTGNYTAEFNKLVMYYNKLELNSYTTNFGDNVKLTYNNSSLTDDNTIMTYSLSGEDINKAQLNYSNVYFRIRTFQYRRNSDGKLINKDGEVTEDKNEAKEYLRKYVFYVTSYYSNDPDEELIRLSSYRLSYSQLLYKLRKAVKDIFNTSYIDNGFAIYSTDPSEMIDVETNDNGELFSINDPVINNYEAQLNNAIFAVIQKYTSKTAINQFSYSVNEDDPEIINLTLTRKSTVNTYPISFIADKTNGYGQSIYYSYINDFDDNYFELIGLDESKEFNQKEFNSPLFGDEVMVIDPEPDDYVEGFERYKDFDGIYFSFFFDGGYVNTAVAKQIDTISNELYALGIHTPPDYYNVNQIINYRNQMNIDSWHSIIHAPLLTDTTIGEFVTYISPGLCYLESIIDNKSAGKEFAPEFGINNGRCTNNPKYNFIKKEAQRETLLNSQINPVFYDKGRGFSYFKLNLTMQRDDTSLSEANNVRMINAAAHVADEYMQQYIGEYNTTRTRNNVTTGLTDQLNSRIVTGQEYYPYEMTVVCNETNNPTSVIEARQIVVDIRFKFTPGIRYAYVYQRVYKLSADTETEG